MSTWKYDTCSTPAAAADASTPERCSAVIDPPCPSGFVAIWPGPDRSTRPVARSNDGITPWGKNSTCSGRSPKCPCDWKNSTVASWFSGLVMIAQRIVPPYARCAASICSAKNWNSGLPVIAPAG